MGSAKHSPLAQAEAVAEAMSLADGDVNAEILRDEVVRLRCVSKSLENYVQHWRGRAERAEADCAAIREEREQLVADKARLEWIADKGNGFAALQLPGECVRRNLHSMRDAIDDAMALQKAEAHNKPELSDGAKPN